MRGHVCYFCFCRDLASSLPSFQCQGPRPSPLLLPSDDLPANLPCPDSEDPTSDWVSVLVRIVEKLVREKKALEKTVGQLEGELEHSRDQMRQLKEKVIEVLNNN